MFINRSVIQRSEQRFKDAKFSPETLDKKLGDGPLDLTDQQKQRRYRQLLAETEDAAAAQLGLERIIQGNDLDSINYLAKGMRASRSICRIQMKDSGSNLVGYASGFLIGPAMQPIHWLTSITNSTLMKMSASLRTSTSRRASSSMLTISSTIPLSPLRRCRYPAGVICPNGRGYR